ncbi:MAG: MFS transporter [Clostridia bacterium]|nr:MFS transporter [Clostridia bacterium]
MATFLLVIIFIDFIGLGIPDSLFGPAWPAIYEEMGLPVSLGSAVSLINTAGTVISSLMSPHLIKRFGTARVTAFSTVVTATALLGFSVSREFVFLCLLSLPLGLGGGAIDTALNNYVSLHYKATHMNFLHCFYGVGVTVSPYFMSVALEGSGGWRFGYRLAFFTQICIAAVTVLSLPLWKRVAEKSGEEAEQRTVSPLRLARNGNVRMTWLMFICSCAIECTAGIWGSTFLVEAKGISAESAAQIIMFYYMGMAAGRFISGLLASRLSSWSIIYLGAGVLFIAVVLLFLPLSAPLIALALFLVGLGNGPVFPNLTHLTPINFGKDISGSVMGSQMAAAYIGIMIFPPLYGILAQNVTPAVFPLYLALFLLLMIAAMILLRRGLDRKKIKNQTEDI